MATPSRIEKLNSAIATVEPAHVLEGKNLLDRFAKAACAPPHRGGLLTALETAGRYLKAACEVFPSDRLRGISNALNHELQQLRETELQTPTVAGAVSDRERAQSVYRLFAEPIPIGGVREQAERMRALLGFSLATAMSKDRPMSQSVADGFRSLLNAFKLLNDNKSSSSDWYLSARWLARQEGSLEELHQRCSTPAVQSFIRTLRLTLQQPLDVVPTSEIATSASAEVAPAHLKPERSNAHDEIGKPQINTSGVPAANAPESLSPLSWLTKRAEFANFRDVLGVPLSWGRLPADMFKQIAEKLLDMLCRAECANFAAVAMLSPILQTPPEILREIPVAADGWLSFDPRGFRRLALSALTTPEAGAALLPVPVVLMDYLRTHTDLQRSRTLGELLRIPTADKEFKLWMSQYDSFLKQLGESAYMAWPSRYCYSLPSVVLELTKSDVVTAILTGDFALCPAATLHYAWVLISMES